jgi:starvation-inducible DNA-binding protein
MLQTKSPRQVGDTKMHLHKTKNDLPQDVREKVIQILNQRLADCFDLTSQAKQAHWNVKGPNFIALHELFDAVFAGLVGHVDLIAERITALGGVAKGTVRMAADSSSLPEYPVDIVNGRDHVDALSTAMAAFGKSVRDDIDKTDELGDADTADLFTNVSRDIDKHLWFVEAHLQGDA